MLIRLEDAVDYTTFVALNLFRWLGMANLGPDGELFSLLAHLDFRKYLRDQAITLSELLTLFNKVR